MDEQGLSVTVIEAPHPLDPPFPDPRRDFYSARRIWLGGVRGTDWLHEALEEEFGQLGPFTVDSERRSTHAGAGAEIAIVVLMLLGARMIDAFATKFSERLGERSGDAFYDWLQATARKRREEASSGEPPPDFSQSTDVPALAEGMKSELADLLQVENGQLELVRADRRESLTLHATYRELTTGAEYSVELGRDQATFRRVSSDVRPPD